MAYQRATHPPSTPLAKALGPPLQNRSTKNISMFPCWDFIKGNCIWVRYHSTSMSTLKHCLQVLICCICKWLPVPSRQQHKKEATLSFPSLLLTMSFKLCKNEDLWKNLLKLYHNWKDRFPSLTLPCAEWGKQRAWLLQGWWKYTSNCGHCGKVSDLELTVITTITCSRTGTHNSLFSLPKLLRKCFLKNNPITFCWLRNITKPQHPT